MSQAQPPPPPEINASPLLPDTGDSDQAGDYIEIEVPVDPEVLIEGGSSGCVWGCGGAMGCMVLIVALLAGVALVGVQSIQDLLDDATNTFSLPRIDLSDVNAFVPLNVPDDVYIPPVERIQALSQLTTTRFNYSHVVTGQLDMPQWLAALYGDGLIMVAVGHIEAGVDMSAISEDDIIYDADSNTLTLTLPAPRLQNCFLDESRSYIVERSTAFFSRPAPTLEDSTRQFAVRQFRDLAIEEGILQESRNDVEDTLSQFLNIVTDAEVTVVIIFDDGAPETATPPQSCR